VSTASAAAISVQGPLGDRGDRGDRLTAALDLGALVVLGWDPTTEVFAPDPSHRLLGYQVCGVLGCGNEAMSRGPLCGGCATRRARHPGQPLEEFLSAGIAGRRVGQRLCVVCCLPGASRPAVTASGLCLSCDSSRLRRGQGVEAFVAGDDSFGPAKARSTFGTCAVVSCTRLVAHRTHGLCEAHEQAWRLAARPELDAFCQTGLPCRGDRRGRIVLHGLPAGVIVEMLFGIQNALAEGRRLSPSDLRATVDHLRRQQVQSIRDVEMTQLGVAVQRFLRFSADRAAFVSSSIEAEMTRDVWDLRHWGMPGRLSFIGGEVLHSGGRPPVRPISQAWLKAAAKAWAADALASRGKVTVQTMLGSVGAFSEYLARRDDAGEIPPAALQRRDIEAFLARLGHLEAAGVMTGYVRRRTVDQFGKFLRDCRALGLTAPGGPMKGLPDEVALRQSDRPSPLRRGPDEVGRALPDVVMAQLLAEESLALLELVAGPMARVAVELQAGVGRRNAELCQLRFSCLDYDVTVGEDGESRASPVLIHDMPKVGKVDVRLPIHEREAKIITAQQDRVRGAFPDTPTDRLVLFPRPLKNPDGTRAVRPGWLSWAVRRWADALPHLDGPERDTSGHSVPFPRERVFPYAFRHSFAQRHADAGTPVDTLKELLGHDTIRVTLGYYRVTTRRKRAAQDALGPLQLDAAGRLVRPGSGPLAPAEALREQVGQVAVPFGVCTEPANVAADGHSCPFRHRCLGCEYFRTDPSYQPELRTYLAQLIADKERLAAAVPQLAEWARADAAPSDEEIDAVRRLLRANDEVVARLADEERRAIEDAIATMRVQRAGLTDAVPVELRGLARQARPTLFPTIERVATEKTSSG
jgi:integrase